MSSSCWAYAVETRLEKWKSTLLTVLVVVDLVGHCKEGGVLLDPVLHRVHQVLVRLNHVFLENLERVIWDTISLIWQYWWEKWKVNWILGLTCRWATLSWKLYQSALHSPSLRLLKSEIFNICFFKQFVWPKIYGYLWNMKTFSEKYKACITWVVRDRCPQDWGHRPPSVDHAHSRGRQGCRPADRPHSQGCCHHPGHGSKLKLRVLILVILYMVSFHKQSDATEKHWTCGSFLKESWHLSLSVLVCVQLLHPVCVAESVQGVLAGGHTRADHCDHAGSCLRV